jgi:hypothetical protein
MAEPEELLALVAAERDAEHGPATRGLDADAMAVLAA